MASPTIDGYANILWTSGASKAISLSTNLVKDVIYVTVVGTTTLAINSGQISVADTSGLVWKQRAFSQDATNLDMVASWWAYSSAIQTSDSITITITKAATAMNSGLVVAAGVNGANLVAPFDSNSSLPATQQTTSGTVVFSTSNPNDILFGSAWNVGGQLITTPTGFTQLANRISTAASTDVSYMAVSATSTNQTVAWTNWQSNNGIVLVDAIIAPTSGGGGSVQPISQSAAAASLFNERILITNSQSVATPATMEQMVTIDPRRYTGRLAADYGNIRFYSDFALTLPLNSWIESTSSTAVVIWVKLTTSIAANSGTTIYMAILSKNTTFDGNQAGVAPQLSSLYAQSDNGTNVFKFYDNFIGTIIGAAWNVGGATGLFSLSNGLSLGPFTSGITGNVFTLLAKYTGPLVIDALQYENPSNNSSDQIGLCFNDGQTSVSGGRGFTGAFMVIDKTQNLCGPAAQIKADVSATSNNPVVPENPLITVQQITTLIYNPPGLVASLQNYGTGTNAFVVTNPTLVQSHYPGLLASSVNPPVTIILVQWFRIRACPPNAVMPTAVAWHISADDDRRKSHR